MAAVINTRLIIVLLCVLLAQGQRGERKKNRDRERGGRGRNREKAVQPTTTVLPTIQVPPQPVMPCDERNSCSAEETKSFYESNCFCDDLCAIYGDCCEDFMRTSIKPQVKITKKMATCIRNREINPEVEVYIVDNCPKDFDDSYVKVNCETESFLATEQFLNFPVSGDISKILYKNYYCAVCAGEAVDEISFWHVKVGCGEGPEGVNITDTVAVIEATLQGSGSVSACVLEYFHPRHQARMCKSNMDHCLPSWKGNKKIAKKCKRGAVSYMYAGLQVFKNKYCAQCCFVNDTYLECIDPRTPIEPVFSEDEEEEEPIGPLVPAFAALLDVNSAMGSVLQLSPSGEIESSETVEVRRCPTDHIYDPFTQACRRLRCSQGMEFQGGVCVPVDAFVTPPLPPLDPVDYPDPSTVPFEPYEAERINIDPPVDSSEMPSEYDNTGTDDDRIAHYDDMVYVTESPESEPEPGHEQNNNNDGVYAELACPTMPLNDTQYFILANNSAYVYRINKAIPEEMYKATSDSEILMCIPENWHENNTAKSTDWSQLIMFQFDRYQDLASFVGLLISLTALMIHFIVYMMLPPLRDTSGKCIISLVVALWLAQALFLAGEHLVSLNLPCFIVAAAMHYTFLVAFFWINVIAIDICRTFSTGNIGSPSHSSGGCCRFACYTLYAWTVPGIIVGGSVAMELMDIKELQPYRPYYGEGLCWLTHRMGLLYLFALPVAAILLINILLYIVTLCQLCRLMRANKLDTQETKERSRFLLVIKLSFIMALTWVFAFLAAWYELWYMWYVFIVFNMLQGVFICFAFICTRNVLKLLKESGRVHRSADGHYYGNSSTRTTALHSGYARQTYLYDGGEAKVISQETSI